MAATRAWNEASPAGTDLASTIDDSMRAMKVDVRERMAVEHVWGVNQTDDGKHGAVTATSLAVSGAVTLAGGLTISSGGISTTNLAVSGAATVGGTFGVTGPTNLTTLNVSSGIVDSGTLNVTGASTLGGVTATNLGVSGNANLGGALNVTGVTTLSGGLTVPGGGVINLPTGSLTVQTLTVTNSATVTGPATVGSLTTNGSGLAVTGVGGITVNGNRFTVDGLTGNTAIIGALGVDGNTVLGNLTASFGHIAGILTVDSNATVAGTLGVTGAVTAGSFSTAGSVAANGVSAGTLAASGTTTLSGFVNVNNNLFLATANDGPLSINYLGGAGTNTQIAFHRAGVVKGSITTNATDTFYNNLSDRRLKTDIVPTVHGLADVLALEVRDFTRTDDPDHTRRTGFIAQQAELVAPDAVTPPSEDLPWYQMDYSKLVPRLVRAIQEQQEQIEELKAALARKE